MQLAKLVKTARIVTIEGVLGIGKSALAKQFAHCYGGFFVGGVFWVNCSKPGGITSDWIRCAEAIGIESPPISSGETNIGDIAYKVRQEWEHAYPCLLIFDQCDVDQNRVMDLLPNTDHTRILITCNNDEYFRNNHPSVQSLRLKGLSFDESVELLRGYRSDLPASACEDICRKCGSEPAVLVNAAKYLRSQRSNIEEYLAKISFSALEEADQKVFESYKVNLGVLKDDMAGQELALMVLIRIACFAPNAAIPWDLIFAVTKDCVKATNNTGDARRSVRQSVSKIKDLGLADTEKDGSVVIPWIVQEVIFQEKAGPLSEAQLAVSKVVVYEACNRLSAPKDLTNWEPHLIHITDRACELKHEHAIELLHVCNHFLEAVGKVEEALEYSLQELTFLEERVAQSEEIAEAYSRIGHLFGRLEDFDKAVEYTEEALRIDRSRYGDGRSSVARDFEHSGKYRSRES